MTDWRTHAACRGEDPELFFPTNSNTGGGYRRTQIAAARTICRRCPVRAECLDFAINTGDQFAIMGALTPKERRPDTARAAAARTRQRARQLAAAFNALSPAAWRAIEDAADDGTVPPTTATETRRALVTAGVADRHTIPLRNATATRLNDVGHALRRREPVTIEDAS